MGIDRTYSCFRPKTRHYISLRPCNFRLPYCTRRNHQVRLQAVPTQQTQFINFCSSIIHKSCKPVSKPGQHNCCHFRNGKQIFSWSNTLLLDCSSNSVWTLRFYHIRKAHITANPFNTLLTLYVEINVMPTLRQVWLKGRNPIAAICVQDFDARGVVQFTINNTFGRALHRHTNRVIHHTKFSLPAVLLIQPDLVQILVDFRPKQRTEISYNTSKMHIVIKLASWIRNISHVKLL